MSWRDDLEDLVLAQVKDHYIVRLTADGPVVECSLCKRSVTDDSDSFAELLKDILVHQENNHV